MVNQLYRFFQIFLFDVLCTSFCLIRLFRCIFRTICSHVFCNIHQHRARPAGTRDMKRHTDCVCQFVYVFYYIIMLGNRHCHTCNVNLLETVAPQHRHCHIRSNCHHRHGIHICGSNTCHQVRSSRPRCGHTYAYLSCGARIPICRMSRSLLMGGQDMKNLILVFIKRVIDIQDRSSRIAKHGINTLFL